MSVGSVLLYEVIHTGYCSLTDSTTQEGKMLELPQTEPQLSAILWLDREKKRQLIVAAAEEGF